MATLRLHRRLGDAVVTEHGEGRYVAYFARGAEGKTEQPEDSAPAPKKERKTARKPRKASAKGAKKPGRKKTTRKGK